MTTAESGRTLAEDLLARAAEDWVSAAEVIDLVRRSGAHDPETLRDLAVGLISRLIVQDLICAGDVVEGRHVPWPLDAGDAIARLTRAWIAEPDPFVMPGAVVWLDTTASGQARGEAIWHRETGES